MLEPRNVETWKISSRLILAAKKWKVTPLKNKQKKSSIFDCVFPEQYQMFSAICLLIFSYSFTQHFSFFV